MKKEELYAYMPHREPMLLLDEAEIDENGHAIGKVRVRGDEFFLQGHFPGNPVVPGIMLCEMMAQTCSILLPEEGRRSTPYFTGIKNAVFKRKVIPGETLVFNCMVNRIMSNFYFCSGEGQVDGELCVKGDFSFALLGRT